MPVRPRCQEPLLRKMIYKDIELDEYVGGHTKKFKNLVGQVFGSWTVLCRAPNDKASNTRFWCECSCGKLKRINSCDLTHKLSTQCRKCSVQKYSKNLVQMYGEIPYCVWRQIQKKSALKDKEFSVSVEYAWEIFLKQGKRCALSGQPIGFHTTRRYTKNGWKDSRWIHTASLDRIDSSKGYVESNVQWIHKDINWMKNSFDQNYFIHICKLIAEHNKGIEHETNWDNGSTRVRKNNPRQSTCSTM